MITKFFGNKFDEFGRGGDEILEGGGAVGTDGGEETGKLLFE